MDTHKIIKLLFIGMAATTLQNCSLDEHPRDQIAEEEAYKTAKSLFINTVITLYSYIGGEKDGQGLQGTCRGVYDLQTFGSDEAILPTRGTDWYDGGLWQDMYRHSWTAGHEIPKNSWNYLYKVITLCNRSIEQLGIHKDMLTASEYQQCVAEVRGLRAIYYWYLLDLFGRVPIVTSTKMSMNEVMQSERKEVFQFVVKELEEVSKILPAENSVHHGDYYGRVTRPVVFFVLAKLMLNAEVYNGTPQWANTISYCDSIEKMGYKLEHNYADNFKVYNENSCENIWIIPVDKDLYSNQQQMIYRSYHYRHAAAYGFTGENGTCATKKVLEVFGYGSNAEDYRFPINYWAGPVYDLNNHLIYDRMGKPLCYYPWEVEMDISGSIYVETAGARMKKYEIDRNATKDGKLMDNDIVLFRFADVLLMRAEAKMRLGRDGQADFDAVRSRADVRLRELTPDNLLDERLLELCWEGWRRQDLIRFGKYKSLFQGDANRGPVDESDGHTTVFPIPGDVIFMNSNITQNKGY